LLWIDEVGGDLIARRLELVVQSVQERDLDGGIPYENISSVRWETDPPLVVGSRIRFEAAFLGRRLTYTYETASTRPASGW
jgi:hypothetical protein